MIKDYCRSLPWRILRSIFNLFNLFSLNRKVTMFTLLKINLRRTIAVLASVILFFGVTFISHQDAIAAEAITSDVTNLNTTDVVSDAEYEADKVSRQREQAMRSKMATPDQDNEGIVDKLNLDETLPRSTKKFGEQITGDEPINNETRP
jgi:hypothetical protein